MSERTTYIHTIKNAGPARACFIAERRLVEGCNLRPVERAKIHRMAEKIAVWRDICQGGTFHPASGDGRQGRVQERSLYGSRIPDLPWYVDLRESQPHEYEQGVDCPVPHSWSLVWREWVLANRCNF